MLNLKLSRMKKILVFVNFIDASQRAIEQAIALASMHNAQITICHISKNKSGDSKDLQSKLKPYLSQVESAGVKGEILIEYGDLYDHSAGIAKNVNPDLIITGTRGIEGFDMSIFGSAIYKLVRVLPFCTLVIHADSPIAVEGFKKVMLPVSPNLNFIKKVEETAKVLAKDGVIYIFAIVKDGLELEAATQNNIQASKDLLDEKGVKWEYIELVNKKHSTGYAKQTLEKIKEDGMDLVSIAADVSKRNKHFGKMDKEDIILNEIGTPILCVNTDVE